LFLNLLSFETSKYTATIIAGVSSSGGSPSGDGGPATAAQLYAEMQGVWGDSVGNLFISDRALNTIRKINTNGIISAFGGNSNLGRTGLAVAGPLNNTAFYYLAKMYGNSNLLYMVDGRNAWKYVFATGIVAPVFNLGTVETSGVAMSANGLSAYIGIFDQIKKFSVSNNFMSLFAGNGTAKFGGDGGPATLAALNKPQVSSFECSLKYLFLYKFIHIGTLGRYVRDLVYCRQYQ
jgi:hypothetical protein